MKVFVAFTIILFTGCASTNRVKTLQSMAVAGALGAAYGLSRPTYPEQNAALFGGLAAAVTGAVGLLIWDSDSEAMRLRSEAQALSEELDRVRAPRRILESPATFGAKIPAKYRSLVQPGSWRVSEIDQWVEDGENRLIHQGLVMELIPPSLNPSHSTGGSK